MKLNELVQDFKQYQEQTESKQVDVSLDIPFPETWRYKFTEEQLERLAIRTIDGLMTDEEALKAEQLN